MLKINAVLNKSKRVKQGKKDTPSLVCIDSQFIKIAPFVSQDTGIDGNKKVNGRKRHILDDDAYKKIFKPWVENNVLGLKVEVASKPSSSK